MKIFCKIFGKVSSKIIHRKSSYCKQTDNDFSTFVLSILASVTCDKFAEFKKQVKIFSEIFRKRVQEVCEATFYALRKFVTHSACFCCCQFFRDGRYLFLILSPHADRVNFTLKVLFWRKKSKSNELIANKLFSGKTATPKCPVILHVWEVKFLRKRHCTVQFRAYIKCKFENQRRNKRWRLKY